MKLREFLLSQESHGPGISRLQVMLSTGPDGVILIFIPAGRGPIRTYLVEDEAVTDVVDLIPKISP